MIEAIKTIEKILGRGIEWFNYRTDKSLWSRYFAEADQIANSETFNNELNHYIADLVKFCATLEGTPLSSDKLIMLTNVQFGIVVLESFRERLKHVEDPNKSEPKEHIHEAL